MTNQTIGRITEYEGTEHPYLRGLKIRIIAVLHNGNTEPAADGEIPGYAHLDNDTDIARFGGVTANDRLEVVPFLAAEGRFSWVSSDPKAEDLTAFENLHSNE